MGVEPDVAEDYAMKYGSVCSGIEAATVAWQPLGWEPAFYSEINPFCSDLLKHHYPQVTNHGDFTKLIPLYQAGEGPHIDLLVGGTPCQSFSIAGLRAGLSDPRGGLALSFVQLVAAARPRWVIWENVPGSLSSDGGRAFASLVGGLQELGYGVAWRVLDAQYVRVDGLSRAVPQRRRRVFLVGHSSGDVRRPAAVLFEPEGSRGNRPPRRLTRQEVAGGSGAGAAGSGGVVIPEVCGTLSDGAHMGGGLNGQDAFSGRIIPVEPAYPIQGVSQGLRVRRLTPLECERLMGFKDDYTNITRKAKRGIDGSRYRALGNSMAVNCMRWIGQRIQLVEDTLKHEGG